MAIKKLLTKDQGKELRESRKHKGKDISKLTRQELDELTIILAKKAGII